MLRLIAVGRLRDGPEADLVDRYNARLRPRFTVTEVAEARGAPPEVKRREGEALLSILPSGAFVVALDPGCATLPLDALISHRVPFDQAGEAFAMLDAHPETALQVVLTYDR